MVLKDYYQLCAGDGGWGHSLGILCGVGIGAGTTFTPILPHRYLISTDFQAEETPGTVSFLLLLLCLAQVLLPWGKKMDCYEKTV